MGQTFTLFEDLLQTKIKMFLNFSAICPCEVSDLNVEITELEPISAYNFEVSVKQVPLEVVVNGGGMQTSNLGSLSISTKCYTKPPKITGWYLILFIGNRHNFVNNLFQPDLSKIQKSKTQTIPTKAGSIQLCL